MRLNQIFQQKLSLRSWKKGEKKQNKQTKRKAEKYCEGKGKGRQERERRMKKAESPADMIFQPEITTAEERRGKQMEQGM